MKRLFSSIEWRVPTLRQKIVIMFAVVTILVIVFGGMSCYVLYRQCLDAAYDKLSATTSQVALVADRYFQSLDSFTVAQFTEPSMYPIIMQDSLLKRQQLLKGLGDSEARYSDEYKQAMRDTAGVLFSSYLFVDERHYYWYPFSYQRDDEGIAEIYRRSVERTSSSPLFFAPSPANPYCHIVRNVNNMPTAKATGTIIQRISVVSFDTILRKATEGVEAYMTDKNGVIYAHKDWGRLGETDEMLRAYTERPGLIFERNVAGGTYLVMNGMVGWNRLMVVCSIDKMTVLAGLWDQMKAYLLVTAIFLGVLGVTLWLSARSTTVFVSDLLTRFDRLCQADYGVRMPKYRDGDLAMLSDAFNGMASEVQRMIDVVLQEKLIRKDSELKFLQAQMNPHFLFNVLTTIRIKAKLNGDENVYQMLLALGELMRAAISEGEEPMVALTEELHYVRQYLFLQEMRFGDKLSYAIHTDDDILPRCLVPRLCVESIVENAVTHGIEHKRESGQVLVDVSRRGNCVIVFIWDDGVGFDVTQLAQISKARESSGHSGIGLYNTDRRLKLIYGEDYGLTIDSTPDKGTSVWIRIPYREE